jgi:hypothetical protein
LTIVGGFAATLGIRWLDDRRQERREDREFRAAAILVDDELVANLGMLRAAVNSGSTDDVPNLQSDAYRTHQLALALGLPADVRSRVATAYSWVQVADVQAFAKARDARDETGAARKALKPYVGVAYKHHGAAS